MDGKSRNNFVTFSPLLLQKWSKDVIMKSLRSYFFPLKYVSYGKGGFNANFQIINIQK